MQPYFLPYIGYFQLMHAVDTFVVYDNIKYTKKGWINRNRILVDGKDTYITIPLANASDFLDIRERTVSPDFKREKMLHQVAEAYRKAPFFDPTYALFEKIVHCNEHNLFSYLLNSIKLVCEYLNIATSITISSGIPIDHSLKAENKVIALCKHLGSEHYINAIGGQELYSKEEFAGNAINLHFIKTGPVEYVQFNHPFVPWLSIIDVLMFNDLETVKGFLDAYTLV